MACTRIPTRFRRDETLITTSFVSTTISLAFPLSPIMGFMAWFRQHPGRNALTKLTKPSGIYFVTLSAPHCTHSYAG